MDDNNQVLDRLLAAASNGDEDAMRRLVVEVYGDLRRLARSQMTGRERSTLLDTTGMVHEWFVRMSEAGRVRIQDRNHFFVLAARIMRQVACAYARKRQAAKRGHGITAKRLDAVEHQLAQHADQFVELDDALRELSKTHPDLAKVVELRFFGGLSEQEVAGVMVTSVRSVQRMWAQARSLLSRSLSEAS